MAEPISSSTRTAGRLSAFFNWRSLRRVLIIAAWAATIIVLLYGVENWRGRRAWKKHEQQLLARGEQLDFRAFLLKPVPAEQNFAATPFVASWSLKGDVDVWQDSFATVAPHLVTRRDTSRRDFLDLVAWQMSFAAARGGPLNEDKKFQSDKRDPQSRKAAAVTVLESMKDIEPKIAELRAASARPFARYPVEFKGDPWSMAFPHLARIKGACQRLQLRASAKLAAGQSAAALDDVKLTLYLAETLKEEPFFISFLVRSGCREMATHVIWEGLAQRAWSDAELQQLEKHLRGHAFLKILKHALAGEHAAGIMTPDLVREFGINYLIGLSGALDDTNRFRGFSGPVATCLTHVIPSGWLYQEKLNYSRLLHMQQQPLFDEAGTAKPRISPAEVKAAAHKLEDELAYKFRLASSTLNHTVFASLLLPALGNITMKAVSAQTSTDHTALACALERYRLAHGKFPETLDALAPRFVAQLPTDLITGEPYKYRRTDDGQFILYSVGWNEKDDNGTPGERRYDPKDGDWVWAYPQGS
jgi:hypothetical protein